MTSMDSSVVTFVMETGGHSVKYDSWIGTELLFLEMGNNYNCATSEATGMSFSPADSSSFARSPESAGSFSASASVSTPVSSVSQDDVLVKDGDDTPSTTSLHVKKRPAGLALDRTADDNGFIIPPLPKRVKNCNYPSVPPRATNKSEATHFQIGEAQSIAIPAQLEPQFQVHTSFTPGSPIALLETQYTLVLGPLLDDLLRLYFLNTHPYYPVIDEFEFDACFTLPILNDVLRNCRACLLGSMLLCALVHLEPKHLVDYPQWDQLRLQQTLFRAVKELYDNNSGHGDNYILCQATILLSYWTPCYAEPEHACNKWLQHAFRHAQKAGLHTTTTSTAITDRRHLIWCCCIIRDRNLSFRGKHKLHPLAPASIATSTPAKQRRVRPPVVEREDFGLEICLPRYAGIEARLGVVDCFMEMYRLSEILADAVELLTDLRGKAEDPQYSLGRSDILGVAEVDVRIRQWTRQLRKRKMEPARILDGIDGGDCGSYYLSNVVAESAIVSLYLPFVAARCKIIDTMASQFPKDALHKVKDASIAVADTIRDLLMYVRPEEIPPFMYSWLPMPILVLLISLKFGRRRQRYNCRNVGYNSDNSAVATAKVAQDAFCLRHLLLVLRELKKRFHGAKVVLDCVNEVSKELRLGVWDTDVKEKQMGSATKDGAIVASSGWDNESECEVLRRAAMMIDQRINIDASTPE